MTHQKYTPKYTVAFRERGVRLYHDNRSDYPSDNAAFRAIGEKLGCSPDSLRSWCHQAERNAGERAGLSDDERRRFKELERENRELRTANEILKKASACFAMAERASHPWRPFRK